MSDASKIMNRMIKHLPKEKTLNAGRIFTRYEDGDRSNLPNEILVKIFQYLSFTDLQQCALVSKGWRVLSLCPVLWRKVHLYRVTFNFLYLERLVNCGVQQLHMESSKICVNSQPLATPYFESSNFKTLQYLRIEWTDIKIDLLEVIVLMVPNLKCFIFQSGYPSQIFSKNMFRALLHLEFLEELHLFRVNLYFPEIMHMLDKIGSVMNLQSLRLQCILQDSDTSDDVLNFVEKYLSLFPNLQCVKLYNDIGICFNDEIFKLLAQLKHLKTLNLGETKVSSEVMEALNLKKNFVHLKELDIVCASMEEESLILLLQTSLNVEILYLDSISLTTAILKALLRLNYMKILTLRIYDVQHPAIFLHDDTLHEFDSRLSSLNLNSCTNRVNLSKMLSLFKYLNNLNLENFNFDEETIIEILKMKNFKTLKLSLLFLCERYLEISSLNQIQVEVYELEELRLSGLHFPIEWILSRTPYLKLLEVCGYPLNKEFLLGVSSLKRLEELKYEFFWEQEDSNFSKLDANLQLDNLIKVDVLLDECVSVPYGLENLLFMCRKVKNLSVHKLHVTEKLFDIIKAMKELEYLEMTDVTMFRDNCVAEILEHCPKLTEHRVKIKMLKK